MLKKMLRKAAGNSASLALIVSVLSKSRWREIKMINNNCIKKALAMTLAIAIAGSAMIGNGNFSKAKEAVVQTVNKEEKEKTDYIVKVKNQSKLDAIKQAYKESDEINKNSSGELEDNNMVSVELSKEELKQIKSSEDIEFIEKDEKVRASKANNVKKINSKDIDLEWNKKLIKSGKHKNKNNNKKKVKIAILDSGVDWGNDIELEETITLVPGEEEMNPLFMDGSGHGNSVAGLIAAEDNDEGITGINPNAQIYSIRVLEDDNTAPLSRVIDGIYYAISRNVDIINMSFGVDTYSKALKDAVDEAEKAGILVVAAAGNTRDNVQYPAAYDSVLAVGSVDSEANLADTSARGEKIDVVAPGELVCSTGEFGDLLIESGTSLAAPQVAAVASKIMEENPKASSEEVKNAIINGANYNYNDEYGILDEKYVLENYDDLKKYDNNENDIKANDTEIEVVENTGCVKGSWSRANHEDMVESGYDNVKAGARFPDEEGFIDTYGEYRFAKISNNPWWHGSYIKSNNYVASYIYATNMANAIGQGKMPHDADIPSGCSYAADMHSDINAISNIIGWKHKLVLNGKEPIPARRRAFVWGMALHTLADTFAHSVFVHDKSGWHHLAHDDGKGYDVADKPKEYEPRFANAKASVNKSMEVFSNKYTAGGYSEFNTVKGQNVYKLKNISSYIQTVAGASAANSYKTYSYSD